MKKTLSVLLATTMAAGTLIACGSSEPAKEAPAATTATPQTEAPAKGGEAAAEPTELEVWCWDPNFNVPSVERAAEIYSAEHPEVTVKVTECTSSDIYTKMTAAIMGNQMDALPDIMLMHDNNINKYLQIYEGVFADLTDSGIDFSEFAEFKVKAGTVNGRTYTVPFDNGAAVNALRTDIISEAGYTIDDFTDITWDEYLEMGKVIYEKTGKSILNERADKSYILPIMMNSAGTWYFDEEGNITISDNEALKECLKMYKQLCDANVLSAHNDSESYYGAYISSELAGGMNGGFILANIMQAEDQSGKWAITNVPRFSNIEGAVNYANNGGSSWLVINNENTEAAIDYLKNTFAGSVELYNDILVEASAVGTWSPAKEAENYKKEIEFFAGQPVYEMILSYSEKVPTINYGVYSGEAQSSMVKAITDINGGLDIETALKNVQSDVEFAAQQVQ